MKTKEELNALKKEVETVNSKLRELTDEEMAQVVGGCRQQEDMRPNPEWMNATRPGFEKENSIRSDPKWCDIE